TGITAVKEIEFLKSRGVDVIVTDHHEAQEEIPDCIVVDPKIERKGFYEFCGAGVAFKLAEALIGRNGAEELLDIAAIATIADIVPLTGENRTIAKLGLDRMEKRMRKGVKYLSGGSMNSHDIMFKFAPRINAAGRMANAMKAVDLFLSDDDFILKGLSLELIKDNALRQEKCEQAVQGALKQLQRQKLSKTGAIVLCGEDWESGILGIACSRLVGLLHRPVLLLSDAGDCFKGSGRSIPEINIFEELIKFKEFFTAFGGHSQAVGLSVEKSRFDEFKNLFNEHILNAYPAETFIEKEEANLKLDIKEELTLFSKELTLLEPYGSGNPKPVFSFECDNLNFELLSQDHIKCKRGSLEFVGFYKSDYLTAARAKCEITANLNYNVFNNSETPQAIIRNITVKSPDISEEDHMFMLLELASSGEAKELKAISRDEIIRYLENPFGTALVAYTEKGYKKAYELLRAESVTLNKRTRLNPVNDIIYCPEPDFKFDYFERAIFFDYPFNASLKTKDVEYYIAKGAEKVDLSACSSTDDELREIYRAIRNLGTYRAMRYGLLAKRLGEALPKFKMPAIAASIKIFSQLGLISLNDKGIIELKGEKTSLYNSAAYVYMRERGIIK
ncbi:MAG: hypothetical protein GX891_00505, partial [Clostridiales bacterium]|nr:hypothetical protein [Clostridiales bacterium]